MADFDIHITGLKELDAALQELAGPAARRAMRKGMRQGANLVRDDVRANAPIDTGLLKRSIRTRERSDDNGWMRTAVEIRKRAFYGKFFEYGTIKMAARPFIRPAASNNTEAAVERMRDALAEAITVEMARARK